MNDEVLILGAGRSGLAAARLLVSEGYAVTVADRRPAEEMPETVHRLSAWGVRLHLGRPGLPDGTYRLGVVSPGFAVDSDWVQALYAQAEEVRSELEVGWLRHGGRTVAVTGSNGKSTAVKWITESLQLAGRRAVAAGNYGYPACDAVREQPQADWLVLEVSSFQLETAQSLRADIAYLTNIHPNHLDRHGSMDAYVAMKARLFAHARADDVCFAPVAWRARLAAESGGAGGWLTVGEPGGDYRTAQGVVSRDGRKVADFSGTLFAQPAMGDQAAAVAGIVECAGIDPCHAVEAARRFTPLPHRVQPVGEIDGVRYVNDSKATNLAAVAHALRAVDGPVRLIAGGLAKEPDFRSLKELLEERVQTVYLIGQSAKRMCSDWSDAVPCVLSGSLEQAFRQASQDACGGEVVLLSPGGASFDQFRDYEQRGERFVELVEERQQKGTS